MQDIYKQIGIYRITNKVNGKSYIGKTGMNFGDRWDSHRSLLAAGKHTNPYLQNAWQKYGQDNFEFVIVEVVDTPEDLNGLEKMYIEMYRTAGLSYNIHDGGDGGLNLGKHLSEETKRKIGSKNRINMTGKKATRETRDKMSQSQSERYSKWTGEDRAAWGKMTSQKASGYRWTDEARSQFSLKQREHPNGAKLTPDDVRSIREKRATGVKLSELAKEYGTSPSYISSIAHRRRWADI